MYSSAVRDGLVRVDSSVGLLAVEECLDHLLDLGDTSGTTDQDDFINLAALKARVGEHLLNRLHRVLKEIAAELFELSSRQRLLKVNAVNEALNEDLDLLDRREVTLGLLNLRFELLKGTTIALDVD